MKPGMEIAFFGSSLVSAYWNGAATYYRGIIRHLYERGHRVVFYEPDAFDRLEHRDIPDPDWARVVVYEPTEEGVLRTVDDARKADLVVKASGVGVHDQLLEEAVLDRRRSEGLVAFWDVDAPATLDRVRDDAKDAFRELIPRYDLIFTYGGGPPVVRAYTELGARACYPVYNALDPRTHFRVDPDPRFQADLVFLGNRLPDRESRVEEFLLRPALAVPDKQFLLGGSGWADKPLPPNVRVLGHVYTKDHNGMNSTPTAVLNINRASMARYGYSPATRMFEAAGAAACMLTDRWEGIELFLEPGSEILVVDGAEDVVAALQELTPERAREIGRAARRHILDEHTYLHRAAQVEAILEGEWSAVKEEVR